MLAHHVAHQVLLPFGCKVYRIAGQQTMNFVTRNESFINQTSASTTPHSGDGCQDRLTACRALERLLVAVLTHVALQVLLPFSCIVCHTTQAAIQAHTQSNAAITLISGGTSQLHDLNTHKATWRSVLQRSARCRCYKAYLAAYCA